MMQPTPAPSSPPKSPHPEETQQEYKPDVTAYPTPPENVGSAPFGILTQLFERLQTERKHDRRRKLLEGWFNHWRQEKGNDLYPVLRLLLPQKDRERPVYGLKQKNLAKIYIKLIPLSPRDPDAIRMTNWKKPVIHGTTVGDFPNILCDVVGKRSSVFEGDLSIDDLNNILDELANCQGKHDVQSKIMQRVYNRATPEEQRWIARIVLKELVISVKETTVFSVFHPDAQDLFNTCSDLKKVAYTLWDPNFRLNDDEKSVQLFHAFAPMLCKRPTNKIEETIRAMGGLEFTIEEKLDGERMQLHKRGNEYFYCSRKGKDYTYLYGKDNKVGSLTPYIHDAFDSRIDDIILDGEMLVWDPVSERNLPFGTLKSAALDKTSKTYNPRPCFKVFDLLYLNGQSLIKKSLKFRKKNMRNCVKEVHGRFEFAVEFKGKTAKDVREKMEEVMASRGEGLVIKHPSSNYVLNGRNTDWFKVKPEYMDNMGETVDVLVVAGNYGTGSRSGGVSGLVCAVMDDRRKYEDDEEPKYSTFVRIGTGLSFSDYVWIRSKPWKIWDPKNPPAFLETAKRGQEDKGDVYLEPEDSFIIKVKAAEITPSDQYHLGFTMRFPRALSIRDDLSIGDCMNALGVMDSMRSEKKRKMEGGAGMAKKKRKVTAKKPEVLPQYQGMSKQGIAVESGIFEGMKFVVMSDPKSRTGEEDKKTIIKMIYANGGNTAQIANSQPGLYVVYGGTIIPYDLKMVIKKDVVDVLKPSWIFDSIVAGEMVPMTKKYFFHATEARESMYDYNADEEDEDADVELEASTSGVKTEEDQDMAAPIKAEKPTSAPTPAVKVEKLDPEIAEWFKVGEDDVPDTPLSQFDDDSMTEDDSENEDVVGEADVLGDDWEEVGREDARDGVGDVKMEDAKDEKPVPEVDVKMGETEDAMEYDQERIFRHLCFYLDSQANAIKNGITVKPSKHEKEIANNFDALTRLITENGGRVVDLDEPKLTHVIVDKRDISRRLELVKRTSKPKRRHLVISEYIQACLDEETLLDEDEFAP